MPYRGPSWAGARSARVHQRSRQGPYFTLQKFEKVEENRRRRDRGSAARLKQDFFLPPASLVPVTSNAPRPATSATVTEVSSHRHDCKSSAGLQLAEYVSTSLEAGVNRISSPVVAGDLAPCPS